MKKFINDLLSDTGRVSSTRFVYVVGHLVIFAITIFVVLTRSVDNSYLSLLTILIGALNTTKLIQKSQESKNPPEGS